MNKWLTLSATLLLTQSGLAEVIQEPPVNSQYSAFQQGIILQPQWMSNQSLGYGGMQPYWGNSGQSRYNGNVRQKRPSDVEVNAEVEMQYRRGARSNVNSDARQSRRFNSYGNRSRQFQALQDPRFRKGTYYGWGGAPAGDRTNAYSYQWQYRNAQPNTQPPMINYGYGNPDARRFAPAR